MESKFCSRCQFRAPAKVKVCPICGNRSFEFVEQSIAETTPVESNVLSEFMQELALTARKSIRAWRQIVRLIRGT